MTVRPGRPSAPERAAGPSPTSADRYSRVVPDRERAAQLAVLVADRVEAVRAGGDDRPLPHPVAVERLDVLPRRGSGTRTRCPSGGPGRRCTTPPGPRTANETPAASRQVATARATRRLRSSKAAAQPTQYRTSSAVELARRPATLGHGPDLERQALRPVEARRRRLAPRVARRSPCPGTRPSAPGGNAAVLEHEVAAQADDLVDVLDRAPGTPRRTRRRSGSPRPRRTGSRCRRAAARARRPEPVVEAVRRAHGRASSGSAARPASASTASGGCP